MGYGSIGLLQLPQAEQSEKQKALEERDMAVFQEAAAMFFFSE